MKAKSERNARIVSKPKRQLYKFAVHFDQVNQTRYVVSAEGTDEAVLKAVRLWKSDHRKPTGAWVAQAEGER